MDHLQTVQQIFTARFLRVPDYQRGYAWERSHWTDLLEDLELLEVGAEHYTGTLVLHRAHPAESVMDAMGQEHGVFDIVDGQQRLTTIVILLDAIRRELSDQDLAEGIKRAYILTRDSEKQLRPKLTLNRDTREYFEQNIIADKPGIDGAKIRSQQQLKAAHGYLRDHLRAEKVRQPDGAKWLLDLFKKVTNGLKLTVYEVPRASEVGVIFEVMNNRGKPLSEMEKVKNYLLYLVSKVPGAAAQKLGERINDTWREVFEGLMESGASGSRFEDQLLRAHWLMVYDYRPKTWAGNNSIKERFSLKKYQGAPDRLIADLDDYVTSLRKFSLAYCDLISPRRTGAFDQYKEQPAVQSGLQHAAEKLVRLDALATFLPVLGAVRLKYPTDSDLYLRFLELCEKYAFRVYRWAKRRSNSGQTTLFKLGHDLYNETVQPPEAVGLMAGLIMHFAPAADLKRELEAPMDWYGWYGLKYFLYEYEEHLAKGKAVQLPWEKLAATDKKDSVEHILPQSPVDPYWTDRWTAQQVGTHLHDIGNLCLTFDNSSYGNKPFPKKRGSPGAGAGYANSNLFMERQLATYTDWTPIECTSRRAAITAWALERWDVTAPATEPVVDEDDDE